MITREVLPYMYRWWLVVCRVTSMLQESVGFIAQGVWGARFSQNSSWWLRILDSMQDFRLTILKLFSKTSMTKSLPHFAKGKIVKGFGRGSKQLGIPTANFPLDVVKALPDGLGTGIYYGWASVDHGPVYKMVMSIGWNPFYDNKEKSMETHIMHNYNRDLYGSILKVCVVGYLRPEKNFTSLESLIEAIHNDINQATELLEKNENQVYKSSPFFFECNNNGHRIQSY